MKYIRIAQLILSFVLLHLNVSAQSSDKNYVLSRTYRVRSASVTSGANYWGSPSDVQTQVQYLDGLGKATQTVIAFGTPSQNDLVARTEYNNVYLPVKQYLPEPQSALDNGKFRDPLTTGYYGNGANVGNETSNAYTETLYDNSPLQRAIEQKAPGVGTGVRNKFLVSGGINYYKVNNDDGGLTKTSYPGNSLNVTETMDENDKKVEQFTDGQGRVILKRVGGQEDTYYVYDNRGLLRYVLQPQYQEDENLDKFAFQYNYDNQRRMTSKRVPGQGVFTMSYDWRDRLEFMTDANGKKFYFKYEDSNNRQTEMGLKKPDDGEEPLLKTYYDNYNFTPFRGFDNELGLDNDDHFIGNPQSDTRRGLVTGTSARILLPDSTYGGFLQTVTYYDSKGRVVQVHRQLYELGGESREQVSYKHDFAGNILEERSTQWTSSGKYRIEKNFTYDHQNRLTSTTHTIYENDTQKKTYTHAANTYNNIGLLSAKELHNGIQKLNYKYTPRGWLNILQNNGGKSFRVELGYNSNGNISSLSWQTNGYSGNFNSIGYDGSNRLNYANGSPLQENGITYDKNGNIKALNRTGAATDQLDYSSYDGNRLSTIKDNSNDNTGVKGGTSTFSYDSNGNMTSDGTKGAAIAYNLLNLPREVTMTNPNRTLQYFYDGGGSKLKMNAPGVSTLYAGAFEYTSNGTLLRVGLEEGQLIRNSAGTYEVNYYLRDHLGNVRQVLNEDGNVLQETEYYPFGLAISRMAGTNKYLYQGKEIQPEHKTYDFHARMYDPAVGRTFQIDPMSESYYSHSSYGWVMNNPLKFMDPTGMVSTHTDEDGNVVSVYDDGDLGVYKHDDNADGNAPTKANIDKRHEESTSAGGEKMGETEFWDEFRNPETGKEIGSIRFGESWDNTIADLHKQAKGMDLLEIRTESKLRGDFDIKNREDLAANGPFTGKLLNGKYASARSAGNYLAGYNAAGGTQYGAELTRTGYLKLAGAYNMTGKLTTGMILGIILGNNSFGSAPYYGEAPYSGRRIIQGWDNKKHGK